MPSDRSGNDGPLSPGRRRALIVGGIGLVAFVGVAALIGRAAHYDRLLEAWRAASKAWFPLMLVGEALAYAGYILAYRAIARMFEGPRLGYWLTTRIVAAGFGALVAATSAGGLAVDYWALRRAGVRRHGAIRRVLALNTLEWTVLAAAAVVAAAAEAAGAGRGAPTFLEAAWLAAVPACVLAAAWTTAPARCERMTHPPAGAGRIRQLLADAIGGVVIVRAAVRRPVRHAAAIGGVAIYWAGDLLCLWGGLRALGVHLGLAALVLGYATGYLSTMLPLPLAGAGGVDAAMVFGLRLVGVPLAPGLLGVLAYRLVNFWLPVVPAVVAGATMAGVREELPAVVNPRAERTGSRRGGPGTAAEQPG
jgi:uncharacterized membrane protein YbhN (UPF0104 family)